MAISRPRDVEEDERCMALALREAQRALAEGEVPVGAVIVAAGAVIARAHNQVVTLRDPTAHAEILAVTQAAAALENERLVGATLYVSLEPCAMCAGALVLARVARVVYGAADAKAGACGSVLDVLGCSGLNHHPRVTAGVMAGAAAALLREFFRSRRRGSK
ncbi:MAG: tRNA adenosine(34) deaminase TadA [Planctomycetes bacterium]|nr:tRNA adenosine(34) deaminase TadA [Planctomycetota bacterium]